MIEQAAILVLYKYCSLVVSFAAMEVLLKLAGAGVVVRTRI